MRFYISSRLSNIDQVRRGAGLLKDRGWTHTCDWTSFEAPPQGSTEGLREIGEREYEGIKAADVVIVLTPQGRGTHIELGMAIALGKRVYIYHGDDVYFKGDSQTCAFYWLPQVKRLTGPFEAGLEAVVRDGAGPG